MGQFLTFPGRSVTLHSGIGRLDYDVVLWDHIGAHSRLPPVNAALSYGLREWGPHTDESPVITVNFNDGKVNPRDNDILRILRSVHPKHTVKRLASLLSIPLRTADSLIYNYFSH